MRLVCPASPFAEGQRNLLLQEGTLEVSRDPTHRRRLLERNLSFLPLDTPTDLSLPPSTFDRQRPPPASSDAPWKHDMFGGSRSAPGSGTHTPRSGGARFDPDRPTERPTARLRIDNVHYEIQPFQLEVRVPFLMSLPLKRPMRAPTDDEPLATPPAVEQKIFAQAGELVDGPKIIVRPSS